MQIRDSVGWNTHSLCLAPRFLRLSVSCKRQQMGCLALKRIIRKVQKVGLDHITRLSEMCAFIFDHEMLRLCFTDIVLISKTSVNGKCSGSSCFARAKSVFIIKCTMISKSPPVTIGGEIKPKRETSQIFCLPDKEAILCLFDLCNAIAEMAFPYLGRKQRQSPSR